MTPDTTALARLRPWQARGVLAVYLLATAAAVTVSLSPLRQSNAGAKTSSQGDVALYRTEVERIHNGEGYYEAANAELRARGYPTKSVFNWRMPLPVWLLGKLPAAELGKAILGGLALVLLLMAYEALARQPRGDAIPRAVLCTLLLIGPLMLCVLGDLFVMPILWAGVLTGLSLCAFGLERRGWGVGFGLAALFVRELSLPYCVLSLGLAVWQRRRGEAVAWLVGLAAWCAFFALHVHWAGQYIGAADHAHAQGWLRFGGAAFLISTAQISVWLLMLPQWVAAIFLAAALLGLASWDTPLGLRVALTATVYLAAFGCVGQEFNQYWGALTAPLWCFGAAQAPWAITDLCRRALAGPVPAEPHSAPA